MQERLDAGAALLRCCARASTHAARGRARSRAAYRRIGRRAPRRRATSGRSLGEKRGADRRAVRARPASSGDQNRLCTPAASCRDDSRSIATAIGAGRPGCVDRGEAQALDFVGDAGSSARCCLPACRRCRARRQADPSASAGPEQSGEAPAPSRECSSSVPQPCVGSPSIAVLLEMAYSTTICASPRFFSVTRTPRPRTCVVDLGLLVAVRAL